MKMSSIEYQKQQGKLDLSHIKRNKATKAEEEPLVKIKPASVISPAMARPLPRALGELKQFKQLPQSQKLNIYDNEFEQSVATLVT